MPHTRPVTGREVEGVVLCGGRRGGSGQSSRSEESLTFLGAVDHHQVGRGAPSKAHTPRSGVSPRVDVGGRVCDQSDNQVLVGARVATTSTRSPAWAEGGATEVPDPAVNPM